MVTLRSNSRTVAVNFILSPPLFEWHGTAPKFFELVHDALTSEFAINLNDFSVIGGSSLGEIAAKYNILGSKSSITLSAEKLAIEFPFYTSQDISFIHRIVEKFDSYFKTKFTNHRYKSIQVITSGHFEIVDNLTATTYLERYQNGRIGGLFVNSEVIHLPGISFTNRDINNIWSLRCTVDSSDFLENGLFLHLDLAFLDGNLANDEFRQKLSRFEQIVDNCLSVLELEIQ